MTDLFLKFVHRYRKGGRLYFYFRKERMNVRLPGLPGSKEFMEAYAAAMEQKPLPIGSGRNPPGSMGALAAEWYASSGFLALTDSSQRTYRRLLEGFLVEKGNAAKPVAALQPRHLVRILEARSDRPAQANALRNVLRLVLQHAFELGWRSDNPARDVKRLRYEKHPFPTWSEEDIAAFESHWASGTRARLALALLLYTGQRRSDVIRMGPQHIQGDAIMVRQRKTGTELALPIHPLLRAELAAAPSGHLAFLVTHEGHPFKSGNAFYNWFSDCARAAGVRAGLSPHGLRKATARRLAEAGCTPHQIAAITGHQSLKEVERYTKAADQRRLAASAVVRLGRTPKNET